MPQLLFVDACVRGAESRSRMLAERFLSSYAAANPDAAILRRDLMRDRLEPQYPEVLARRDALAAGEARRSAVRRRMAVCPRGPHRARCAVLGIILPRHSENLP